MCWWRWEKKLNERQVEARSHNNIMWSTIARFVAVLGPPSTNGFNSTSHAMFIFELTSRLMWGDCSGGLKEWEIFREEDVDLFRCSLVKSSSSIKSVDISWRSAGLDAFMTSGPSLWCFSFHHLRDPSIFKVQISLSILPSRTVGNQLKSHGDR